MNKEEIDKILKILIALDNGDYDDDVNQQAIIYTKLYQLLGIDNYTVNNPQDIPEDIFYMAMKQIEQGDIEYFKAKIKNEEQEDIYNELLHYSYDFDTKKDYIKQHYNTENKIDSYCISNFSNIIDLMKFGTSDLDINKILNEQQDFVKWCVENAKKLGLYSLEITDVIKKQQQFIEYCMENSKKLGINIEDMVNTQQKLVMQCLKNNQQMGYNNFNLRILIDEQFNSFISCIENVKNIVLNGGNFRFLIQTYHDLFMEANSILNGYNSEVKFLDEISKWYNENKDIEKNDLNHFIDELCKKCIDDINNSPKSINSNQILSIIRNNINDPEYVKRTYRKTRTT